MVVANGAAQAGRARVVLSDVRDFRLGCVAVSPSLRRLSHDDGRSETLEPRVMQVLAALAMAEGAVLSRDDLQQSCWDGRAVTRGSLNRVVSILRGLAVGIGAGSFEVVTVNRVGYRLDAASAAAATTAPTLGRRGLMLGAGLVAAAAAGGGLWLASRQQAAAQPTIAVMPFDVVQAPPWIGPALAREVRQDLSRISGLRTISEASSFSLAGQGMSVAALARRLGADFLVVGSAQGQGGGYVGGVELVDGRDQSVAWSGAVTESSDLAGLIAQLSSLTTERLVRLIAPAAGASKLPPRRTSNPRAFQHVLRAEAAFLEARTLQLGSRSAAFEAAAEAARAEAQAALEVDPGEVRALLVLWSLARNGWSERLMAQRPAGEDLAQFSMRYVRRALLADPNDPAALAALGDQYRRDWRWSESEALLRRAIAADPSLVEARWAYGTLLGTLNRGEEGVAQAREMVLLDPENISRRGYLLHRLQYAAGDRDSALRGYHAALVKGGANLFDLRELYMSYLTEGGADGLDALQKQAQALIGAGDDARHRLLERIGAAAEALRGRPQALLDQVEASMRELVELKATQGGRRGGDLIFLASLEYAWCGAVLPSLTALERAVNARSLNWTASLPYGRSPFPKPVRNHARFAAIWKSDPQLAELMALRAAASR